MRARPYLLGLFALAALASATPTRAADDTLPDGQYKLVIIPSMPQDYVLFDVKANKDDPHAPTVKVLDARPPFTVKKLERQGETVTVGVDFNNSDTVLRAKLAKDGKAYGTIEIQGTKYPALLEKAEGEKLPAQAQTELTKALQAAMTKGGTDPKARLEALKSVAKDHAGNPGLLMIHRLILTSALEAKLPADEVRALLNQWAETGTLYGSDYQSTVRSQALSAMAGKKEAASLAIELAQGIEKELPADAPASVREPIVVQLLGAAKLAGDAKLIADAEKRAKELSSAVDEEYKKTVPPFKPTTFAGRSDAKSDRVVLMELFTGAQCPPCVAADVAFDALNESSYKPTDLITLQYHLHIPGPDPLTNADSEARAKYYKDLRGTPSVFFNGKTFPGGGGYMQHSEGKYAQYQSAIREMLNGTRQAEIDLKADAADDTITIKVDANTKEKGSDLKLRLVVVEEVIRYVGGNKLRFHHHVVRAMPGGAEGTALEDGKLSKTFTLKRSEIRQAQEKYLADYEPRTKRSFPSALPEIELKDLHVVAFVQDDKDLNVLHAVQVPVKAATP